MKKILLAGDRLFMKFPALNYFESRAPEADAEIVSTKGMSDDEFIEAAKDASAICVIARPIPKKLIESAKKCEIIMTLSVGYDCVDIEAATAEGIPVSNSPTYCSDDVANHAMTLILAVSRKLHKIIPEINKSNWDYKYTKPIFNYRGKKLGVIGLGKIGRKIVPKAKGFGMDVIAFDPYIADDIFELLGVERKYELNDLLDAADYITVHAPLTPETRNMIGEKELSRMKGTAFIVNTARGPIINQNALVNALNSESIAGAGIDVLEKEPLTPDNPLLSAKNILLTPHIAWYSEESFEANKILGMDEMINVLNGGRPRHIVNPEIFGRTYRKKS